MPVKITLKENVSVLGPS